MELSNGCVCCTLAAGLPASLQQLAECYSPELILLEASGVALLGSLTHVFENDELCERFRIAQTVTVVDARRYALMHGNVGVIDEQVRGADVVILNRSQSVDPATLKSARLLLGEQCPHTPVFETEYCEMDFSALLNGDRQPRSKAYFDKHESWHSCTITATESLPVQVVVDYVRSLPESILRVKGFWDDAGERMEIQRVGLQTTARSVLAKPKKSELRNCLVLIGATPIRAVLEEANPLPGKLLIHEGSTVGHG